MERGSITKWLFLGLAVLLFIQFGWPLLFGSKAGERQPLVLNDAIALPAEQRSPEEKCEIEGPRFRAELSTRGGSLRHIWLTDPKYTRNGTLTAPPIDLVTTTREERSPLRTDLHIPGLDVQQVPYNDVDWKLGAADPAKKSCSFTYKDAGTEVTKVVSATEHPFELAVEIKVQNLSAEPRKHRLAFEQTAYRTKKETEGSLGLIAEAMSETVTASTSKVERQLPDAFDPDDFKKPEFTEEKWRREAGDARFVATSSVYFSQVAIPAEGPHKPAAESQIEEVWDASRFHEKAKDPSYGHVYRSRLAYQQVELQPGGAVTYKVISYTGPKERELLNRLQVTEVINLGFFTVIARVLVSYLYVLFRLVGSWGWAICLLTITVRLLLFPLSISQIKNSAAMRRLKPEMDALNDKYKDDAAQRGLAMQELWRKNGVANPVVGCLPLLLQMPVWFALYTALQTAVELYHTPFGPVIPDLSAPGKYFIIPIVLGASSFVQQKLMPAQGDPAQQKMMLYLMPGIFTVMMLFLPAGLGVYMLTNTWLGITQQVLVERYLESKRLAAAQGEIEVREKTPGDGEKPTPALGKGKARVRG